MVPMVPMAFEFIVWLEIFYGFIRSLTSILYRRMFWYKSMIWKYALFVFAYTTIWRFKIRDDSERLRMSGKIPKVKKFSGEDSVNFKTWIAQYEAQSTALAIADDNRRNVLLCCLDSTAFSVATDLIASNANTTYDDLKEALNASFCGEDYRRSLESVLRGLVFTRDQNVQLFKHKLTSTIKELYGIVDSKAINNIAMNHVVANIHDDKIRDQIRILQLSGTASLASVLELISAVRQQLRLRRDWIAWRA